MTDTRRKFALAALSTDGLADKRQVLVNCSSESVDRQGDIVVQSGIQTESFVKTGGTVLWNHDPATPIARALTVAVEGGQLRALAQFPDQGVSPKADEIYGLVKAGVINSVSIGFKPLDFEPIDPKDPWGGQRFAKVELMEFSFVSVPAQADATIIARSHKSDAATWKVGASLNLPIGDDGAWDGAAAQASIFAQADFDGDNPDYSFARKGFLIYDASAPKQKGSYRLPFAQVVDGHLTAMPSGLRAASRGPQTDISEATQTKARAVLDHYEAKMSDKSAGKGKRKSAGGAAAPKVKGLYDVAYLAQLLMNLGYIHSDAVRETEYEGDNSQLPAMLANALKVLADAFLAMSREEVAELLAGHDVEVEADDDYVAAATTPKTKRFRSAFVKAGRALSEENMKHVKAVLKCFGKAMDCRTKALDSHGETSAQLEDFATHLNEGVEHAKALMKSNKQKPKPDDGEGSASDDDDYVDPEDDDADVELAVEAERRKRVLQMITAD